MNVKIVLKFHRCFVFIPASEQAFFFFHYDFLLRAIKRMFQLHFNPAQVEIRLCKTPLIFLIFAQTETDHCLPNPCMNSGVCFENADTFTCQCANNFHGQHCAGNSTFDVHFNVNTIVHKSFSQK